MLYIDLGLKSENHKYVLLLIFLSKKVSQSLQKAFTQKLTGHLCMKIQISVKNYPFKLIFYPLMFIL